MNQPPNGSPNGAGKPPQLPTDRPSIDFTGRVVYLPVIHEILPRPIFHPVSFAVWKGLAAAIAQKESETELRVLAANGNLPREAGPKLWTPGQS